MGPEFAIEPPHWIVSAPHHFGDAFLALDLPDRALRYLHGRYEDVLDLYHGRYEDALAHLQLALEAAQAPREKPFFYYRTYGDVVSSLVETYLHAGRYEELVGLQERLGGDWEPAMDGLPEINTGNRPWPATSFAFALLRTGRPEEAAVWLDRISARLEERRVQGIVLANHAFELARVRAMQGRHAEALEALTRAVELGWRRWYVDRDPVLQMISDEPGFSALMARYRADIARMRTQVLAERFLP